MVQEAASPEAAPLPVPQPEAEAPVPDEETTAQPEAEQQEPAVVEDTPEPAPERTPFDPDAFAEDESFTEYRETVERKAHKQGQIREAGRRKESQQRTNAVLEGVQSLNQTLQTMAQQGNYDAAQVIKENAPILNAYGQILQDEVLGTIRSQNMATAYAEMIHKFVTHPSVNKPELGAEYYGRFVVDSGQKTPEGQVIPGVSDEFAIDMGADAISDFVKDVWKTAEKAGFDRAMRENGNTDREEAKASARDGQGAATVSGQAGGGISSMDEADRLYSLPSGHPDKITHEVYKEAVERFGVKI